MSDIVAVVIENPPVQIKAVQIQGGPQGFSGKSGYSGFSGATGTGTSGFSGYSGFSSFSGYSGFSGKSGYSGFSGPSGYSGFSGLSGYSGFCGATGGTGGTGTSGFSGYCGLSGYSGFCGLSGYSGFCGLSGYSGFCGLSGYSGFSSTSGYSGFSSTSGYSGFSSLSGYSGFCGLSGYSGFCGLSGYSGFCGLSGYSGFCGLSGYSGFSGFSAALTTGAGLSTTDTTVSNQQTPTTSGVTLASQTLASGSMWLIRAFGDYVAANSATARNFEMQPNWAGTNLTKVAVVVKTSVAATTGWFCEFLITGTSTTAAWVSGVHFGSCAAALASVGTTATSASNTGLTSGAQTLDFRVDTSASVVGDSIVVKGVLMMRVK